jgi:hypothetical protein
MELYILAMNRIIVKSLLFLICLSPFAQAQTTIRQQLTPQLVQFRPAGDDEFNIPLAGGSDRKGAKSRAKAALFSLILPGAGQYYITGGTLKAKMFFGVESGLWFSFYGFRQYSQYKSDASKGWAVLKAGANPDNKDSNYWIKMTYYDNRDINETDGYGYNQMIAVFDRENALIFPETPDYFWNWDSKADRDKYRNLRNQSKTADKRADLILGGIVINHVFSAIEAFMAAGNFNRRLEFSGLNIYYSFKPNLVDPSIKVGITKSFN